MIVNPNIILPSQNFLRPNTIKFILECLQKGDLVNLPPNPIVREDSSGNLVAIDGHNLIAVRLHRHEDIEVHLATSSSDGLEEKSDADIKRNSDLKHKFDSILLNQQRVYGEGVKSFTDLVGQYPDLFT